MSIIDISVVVPVYGCNESLIELYERLTKNLSELHVTYEVIFVDDSCPENAWGLICDIGANDEHVKGIKLSRNFGQHIAITAGLNKAKGKWIVVMDCDLQDMPEEIGKLYAKAQEGFDIVFAKRARRKDSWFKRVTSASFYKVLGYLSNNLYDAKIANFGIYNKKVIQSVLELGDIKRMLPLMVMWVGFRRCSIEVEHAPRAYGQSQYSFLSRLILAFGVIIGFSEKLLRLIAGLGLTISLATFSYVLWLSAKVYFMGGVVEGWASLMVSIWFFSGLILFAVGVVGIYVGKTFEQTKQRPLYIIDKTFG